MSWNIRIRAINEDGEPKGNVRVNVHFSSHTKLNVIRGGHLSEYTDRDGWAEFSVENPTRNPLGISTIYIDGNKVDGSLRVYDGDTKSYTV